jgi:LmeA-like phospholipid-binding
MPRLIVAALTLLALAAFATASMAQPPRAFDVAVASPGPTATAAPSVASLASEPASSPPSPTAVAFEVDEQALTAQLNAALAGRSLGETLLGTASAEDMAVYLRDDQLVINGTLQAGEVRLPLTLAATAAVQSGHVLVQVRAAELGNVSLPEGVRRELEQRLQDQVDQSLANWRLEVQSVHIGDGKLAVAGTW